MAPSNEHAIAEMNEVIALFDGWIKNENGTFSNGRDKFENRMLEFEPGILQYHLSWNPLMDCWKKVGKIIYNIRMALPRVKYLEAHIITRAFIDACQKVIIEDAHWAVYNGIQLIEWYNKNKDQ